MAVAGFAGDIARGRGRATARLVDHLKAHGSELFLLDHGDDLAREKIVAGARPAMHDNLDRASRLEFGHSRCGPERDSRQKRAKKPARNHSILPIIHGLSMGPLFSLIFDFSPRRLGARSLPVQQARAGACAPLCKAT